MFDSMRGLYHIPVRAVREWLLRAIYAGNGELPAIWENNGLGPWPCGMHLVMAMQNADRDVLTVSLRNNLQGRIAYKTRSQSESRRIVDSPDVDVLCAPGDMLVRQKDDVLVRAQCAYSSTMEECKIIEDLISRYPRPAYIADI